MSINLKDIRTAVINYVDTQITISVSNLISAGASINPGETFSIKLGATNADAASDGMPLKGLVWHVLVQDDAVAKLIVPGEPMLARSGLAKSLPTLAAGSQVREMYLSPRAASGNRLGVGDTESVTVSCRAGSSSVGGACFIFAKVYANPDPDWLFPKEQDSYTGGKYIEVVG